MTQPVPTDEPVTVYSFMVFDLVACELVPGHGKTTRQAIEAMGRAQLLEATAEEVPRHALDRQGIYRRVATGWGELA